MTSLKSSGSDGGLPPDEPTSETADAHALPTPVANPPNLLPAKSVASEPVVSGAAIIYRAANKIALAKAREAAQSEEEVILIFPTVFAQVMSDYPVAELAELFARADDPELLRIRLLNDCAVERYLRSKRTKKTTKNKRPT
jgi:hypothetical protein